MTRSKLRSFAGAAILVATSCAGHDDEQVTATATAALDSTPVAANVPIFVTLESSREPCPNEKPLACPAGYWVREVNREGGVRLVSRFDVRLAPGAMEQAAGAGKGELLFRGVFEPVERPQLGAPFVVVEAWRGMPGVQPSPLDHYFAVDKGPNRLQANLLNGKRERPFGTISLSGFPPWVDTDWLSSRVLNHGAIVAGQFDGPKLEASQAFVRLPDAAGPCPLFRIYCGDQATTYERDDNRCLIPTGCAVRGPCPLFRPSCAPGYVLAEWSTQPSACEAFACDPAFLRR